MTCIVGIRTKDEVYIGGDSQTTMYGDNILIRKDKKIFRKGNMLFGVAGRIAGNNILQYKFSVPEHPKKMSDMEYLVSIFIPELRNTFKEAGYSSIENNKQEFSYTQFILAYNGKLYEFEGGQQSIWESKEDYVSIGSGHKIAKGVLEVTKGLEPKERIKTAIKVASKLLNNVGGKIYIDKLGKSHGQ